MTTPEVHHVTHPLVQHKLSLMRQKDLSTMSFRRLLHEISMLMAYEVTRDMPTHLVEIETPLEKMMAPMIDGKKTVFVVIMRAGSGFLDGPTVTQAGHAQLGANGRVIAFFGLRGFLGFHNWTVSRSTRISRSLAPSFGPIIPLDSN